MSCAGWQFVHRFCVSLYHLPYCAQTGSTYIYMEHILIQVHVAAPGILPSTTKRQETYADCSAVYASTYRFHAHAAQFLRLPNHLTRYTRLSRTGTSIKGPTVAASAWSLSTPYVETATAMANSKLLLAAVKP